MLKVTNIQKSFNGHHVLKGIDFEINKGEVVAILGPSGSGKTTFLRCLNLLERPEKGVLAFTDGSLTIDFSKKISKADELKLRRRSSMVFQQYNLFPHRTALENVMEGMVVVQKQAKEIAREKALALLEKVGLKAKADLYPSQLSGGQQQRVALARALAPSPELILFDEPFSALDEHLRNQIRYDMLQVLRESGSSAIFVTHDRDEALCYADKIAVIQEGRILQIATPKTLYWSPQHLSIATFIGESIIFSATLKNDGIATCQLGEIAIENKGNGHTQGKVLFRPEQFSLAKKIQDPTASFKGEIKRIESRGRAINLCIDVGGYEFNLNEDLINHYQIGEQVTLYLYGKGVFYND